jgi:predicted deacylase
MAPGCPGKDGWTPVTVVEADAAVIGVGSVGSMASWQLATRGLRVVGILPLFEDAAVVHSDRPGLWFLEVAPGTPVAEGTRLGRIEDPLGDVEHEVLAPAAGVLMYGLGSLAAVEGSILASIVRPMPAT